MDTGEFCMVEAVIPFRIRGQGYKISPVCQPICASVSSLSTEPFDVLTQNLLQRLTLTMPPMGWKVKALGQGH